jgi:hypothetical protein
MGAVKQQAIAEAEGRGRSHKWDKPFGWRNPPGKEYTLYCYRCCGWRKQDPEHPGKRKFIYSDGRGNTRTAAGVCK